MQPQRNRHHPKNLKEVRYGISFLPSFKLSPRWKKDGDEKRGFLNKGIEHFERMSLIYIKSVDASDESI